jgi:hypothetical protein
VEEFHEVRELATKNCVPVTSELFESTSGDLPGATLMYRYYEVEANHRRGICMTFNKVHGCETGDCRWVHRCHACGGDHSLSICVTVDPQWGQRSTNVTVLQRSVTLRSEPASGAPGCKGRVGLLPHPTLCAG